MKAVIPLAGKGTRLRPHTFLTPKPLLRVGGRPVMSYILDDLQTLGIEEIVFVIGYLGDVIKDYMAEEYPNIRPEYVVQEVQDGTAGAVKLAEPFVDGEVLILFVDTLFEADLSMARGLDPAWSGVIWAKEVEDYQRFGVIVTDEKSAMTRIVEKPSEPISKLANIGLYYIRDHKLLFEGIDNALHAPPGPSGEFYLTEAFQYMVDQGADLLVAPVEGWYDCGKPETLLETNRHLLETTRGGVAPGAQVDSSVVGSSVRIEEDVVLVGSHLGPNVTVERGARIVGSTLRDCIVGPNAVVEDSILHDSLVGGHARVAGFQGSLSVLDYSEVGK
ncbi:MAG: sugar nucleotidyltransferase [Longimicrobiales bacterium]